MAKSDKIIFGVSGWLARKLGIDISLVRIGFVFFGLFIGSGILLYLFCWLIKILEENN